MYALFVEFKSQDAHEIRCVTNNLRQTAALYGDEEFSLTTSFDEAHVFYTIDELRQVQADIVRVLNRRGYEGGEFDENRERTKDVVRTIRSYLNMRGNRFTIQFDIQRLVPESMGKVAFAIRSDVL